MKDKNEFTPLNVLNHLTQIHNSLIDGSDRIAFYHIGVMTEWLAEMIRKEDVR